MPTCSTPAISIFKETTENDQVCNFSFVSYTFTANSTLSKRYVYVGDNSYRIQIVFIYSSHLVTKHTSVSIISSRGLIGLGVTVLVLLTYCCFAFAIALRELCRMNKPRMEEKQNLSASSAEIDEKQANEKHTDSGKSKQAHSMSVNVPIFINENTVEHKIDTETNTIAIVGFEKPISTEHAECKSDNPEKKKVGKPFFSSKQQKKVQFIIDLAST